MTVNLFDLPLNLIGIVFKDWLSIPELVHVDSALCNRSLRRSFLEVLSSEVVVLDLSSFETKLARLIPWIVRRKLKVDKVGFEVDVKLYSALIALFFSWTGSSLCDISINDCEGTLPFVCCLAIAACTRLKVLHLWNSKEDATGPVRTLITHQATTLERLAIEYSCAPEALPSDCDMTRLQYLGIYSSTVNTTDLCAFVRNCRSLLYFFCHRFEGNDDVLYALAQSCPSLVSLHYGYAKNATATGTAGLEVVLRACKELHTVDFTSSHGFTTAHVTAVVQHCRKLRALRLNMNSFTAEEECLTVLAPRVPELVHLSLSGLRSAPPGALLELGRNGQLLKILELDGAQIEADATCALLSALPHIEVLDLSGAENITDAVLTVVGRGCKRLQVLDLTSASGFTGKGIAALVRGCAALRRVYIESGDTLFNQLALTLLKVHRPGLTIEFMEECRWTRWNDIRASV